MRIAYKFTLLLTAAMAAAAFAASAASAAEAIEVVSEPNGSPCDPCSIHIVGESSLSAFHVITISSCTDEFTGTINANATGQVNTWNGVSDLASGCTREQCTNANGTREPWPGTGEEVAENAVQINIEFCLSPVGQMSDANKARCDAHAVLVEEASQNHHYSSDSSYECFFGGVPVEIHGDWALEGAGIEAVHQS
jgi:hypothetical protein